MPKSRTEKKYATFLQVDFAGVASYRDRRHASPKNRKLKVGDCTTLASSASRFVRGGKPDSPRCSTTSAPPTASLNLVRVRELRRGVLDAGCGPGAARDQHPGQSVESFLDLEPVLTENLEAAVEYKGAAVGAQLAWFESDSDRASACNAAPMAYTPSSARKRRSMASSSEPRGAPRCRYHPHPSRSTDCG